MNNLIVGNLVQFYDSHTAHRERDYSGSNPKHYPVGKVIKVYDHKSYYGGHIDRVCDIFIEGRVSKGHFITGVTLI